MKTQTLLFYLHSIEPIRLSFTELDENKNVIQTQLNLDEKADFTKDAKKIIVIIPAIDILLTTVDLPKLTRKRLRQAVPFVIEEKLIDDVTELHFAMGEHKPENEWPIAVINKQIMSQWIEALDNLGIYPNKIIPVTLALPFTENRWTVYHLNDACYVRTNNYSGFACETANLGLYLDTKINEENVKPVQIDIYSANKINITLSSDCSVIHSKISEEKMIESLAYTIKNHPTINLLQGPFRTKRKSIEAKKFWIYAGYATLAWISIGLISNLLSLFVLHNRDSTINQQINGIYQRHFPHADSRMSAKQRMEEKLKQITMQASNESFLVLLANIAKAYAENSGTRIQSLDYRDKQFTLEISANSFDDLDKLTRALQQNQLNVKQQHAEMIAGRAKAALQVSGV